MLATNLIPASRLEARRRAARIRFWGIAAATYALALVAGSFGVRAALHADGSQPRTVIVSAAQQIDASIAATQRIRRDLNDVRRRAEAARQITNRPDWSVLLALLARDRGDEVVLTTCSLETLDDGAYKLNVSGLSHTPEHITGFILALERSGIFDRVALVETVRRATPRGEAVAFTIDCRLGGGEN